MGCRDVSAETPAARRPDARLAGKTLDIADSLAVRIDGLRRVCAPIGAERTAPRRNQGTQFRLESLGEGLGEQMRKPVRRALRQAHEHFRIEIPILRLVLRSEDAAFGGPFETFLEFLWIDTSEEFFEGGAGGGECRGILRFEFAEILAYRLDRPRAGRQGGQQAHPRFVDPPREIQRRFGAVVDRRRNAEAVAEFIAAL